MNESKISVTGLYLKGGFCFTLVPVVVEKTFAPFMEFRVRGGKT
jgi:hypothetical protein